MSRAELYDQANDMDQAIYDLHREGMLTTHQKYHCDKKLRYWTISKGIKWYKKIRG
jgi:hypothetical protein